MLWDRKNTKFVGGGLFDGAWQLLRGPLVQVPENFSSPAYVDGKPYCIESSNQGATSHCAGYATAGMKEVLHWRETGVRAQYDGDAVYKLAKTLDGFPTVDGTTLQAAARAADGMNWFPGRQQTLVFDGQMLRWALHRYGCCVAGFGIDSNWNRVNRKTGWIARSRNPKPLGGHAVLVCYYDKDGVGFQNSWGTDWGVSGFGRMSWEQFNTSFIPSSHNTGLLHWNDDDGTLDKRFFFDKSKAAFAAGEWTGTEADDANRGFNTTNLSRNTTTSAYTSASIGGENNTVSGNGATAVGCSECTGEGQYSAHFGKAAKSTLNGDVVHGGGGDAGAGHH